MGFQSIFAWKALPEAGKKPGMRSSGVCVLGCSAFRGSDRLIATVSIRQRHVDAAARGCESRANTPRCKFGLGGVSQSETRFDSVTKR